jgi:bacterioferritin-associated ferredoxin
MIICSCNVITDEAVRSAIMDADTPVRTSGEVYSCLGCSPQCGRCARSIKPIMRDALTCYSAGWIDS